MVLEALLRHGSDDAMIMVSRTCEAMARGGMCDQLGGGFARYSVDSQWVVPHFEKMLYDNALLLGVTPLVAADRESGRPSGGERPDGMAAARDAHCRGWIRRQLDADSLDDHGRHREGAYYAWNREQLGSPRSKDASWAAEIFS